MQVKLLVSRTGGQNRDDVIEVEASEGQRMIDAGQAVLARSMAPEKATNRAKKERATK